MNIEFSTRTSRWLFESKKQYEQNRLIDRKFLILPDGRQIKELELEGVDIESYCLEQFQTSLFDLIDSAKNEFERRTDAAVVTHQLSLDQIEFGDFGGAHENILTAERDLIDCAQQGYPDAQVQLGLLYCSSGKYFGRTEEDGLLWLTKAFNSNHSDALSALGIYHLRKENWDKAARYFRQGDKKKCPLCAFMLARMYHEGVGSIEKDLSKAFKLYREASSRGYPDATVEMVELFLDAPEKFPLKGSAEELLCEAIADGFPKAMFWLADMFENGLHVPKDLEKSIAIYKQAAELGLAAAQLKMGNIYDENHPDLFAAYKDREHALRWYALAASNQESTEVCKRAYLALGDIQMGMEEYDQARQSYRGAMHHGSVTAGRLILKASCYYDVQQTAQEGV